MVPHADSAYACRVGWTHDEMIAAELADTLEAERKPPAGGNRKRSGTGRQRSVMVEIRAAEGGADAKDLVREQAGLYGRYCKLRGLDCEIVDERPGTMVLEVSGLGAVAAFAHEAGGHRFQRVPPTEKRGRRHTSTVTVAVMPVRERGEFEIRAGEVEWQATVGTGSGGQARNKTASAVQMRHLPSGLSVRCDATRSQTENREIALRLLSARLDERERAHHARTVAAHRREQVGSGMRGDKIRTVRLQDDTVTDHVSGRSMKATRYLKGFVHEL